MIFANATYLWGLLGLLLPIAIHLWSRKKVRTIKIGSIKLLEASEPKQTSSIKLNELWLLLLRLLTILLLALILAAPSITTKKKSDSINYLVESSLVKDELMGSVLDTIPKEFTRILENGFPKWDDYDFEESRETPLYWQLAQEMQSISADSIIVFSKGLARSLKGKRPKINANTRWIVIQTNESGTSQKVIESIDKDSYTEVLSVAGTNIMLSFEKDSIPLKSDAFEINPKKDSIRLVDSNSKDWMALKKNTPIQIGILVTDSLKGQFQLFRAAYRGISRFLNQPVTIEYVMDTSTFKSDDFDMFISFDDKVTPNDGTKTLLYRPDELADELITKGPTKNVFHLTRLLDSENIVKEQLPERLLKVLELRTGLEEAISSNDIRTVTENELQPLKSKGKPVKNRAHIFQMTSWLWLVLILVVILERFVSKLRKQ